MDQSSRNQPSDDTFYNNFGISASRGLRDTRTHDRRLTESKARDSYGRVGGGNVGENPENLQGYSLQMSRKDNWRTTNRDIENNETHVKHIEDIQQPSSFQDTQLKTEENRNYGQARLGPSRIEESSRPLSDTRQNGSQYNDGRDFQFGVSGIYGDSKGRYNFDDHHSEIVEPHEKRKNSNVSSNLSWIDMAFSGTFRRNYFDKIDEFRPRISVRGNTKSYNYAKDDEISEFSTRSDARYCSRCCVLTVAVVLVVLLLTAAIAVPVVLVNMKDLKPTPNTTQYYEIVDMNATLARVFIKEYGQPDSPQFKAFNEEFCLTIQNTQSATSNGTYKETYQGCEVSDIRNGSCIVSYTLIFIRSEIPVLATSIVDDVSTQWMPTANDFNLITINVIKIQTEAETIKIRSIKMKSDNYGKTSTSVTPSTIKISNSTTVTPLSTTQTDTINTFDLTTTSTSTTRIDKTSTASSTVIVDTTNTFSTMPSETTTEMASTTPIKTISTAGSKSSAIPTSISTRSVITTTNFHTKDLDTTSTEGSTSTKSTINTVDITTASTAISTSPSTKNTKESTTTMPTTSTVDTTASSTPLSTTSTEGSTTKMSGMTTAGTTTQTTTFTAPSTTNTEASTMTTTDATTTSTTTIPPSTTGTEGHTTDTTTSTTASTSPFTTSTEESTKTMAKTSTVKTTVIYTASSTPFSTTSNEGSTTKMSAMTTAGTTEHTTTFTAPSTTNTEASTMTTTDATTTGTTTIPPSTTSTGGPTTGTTTSTTASTSPSTTSTEESTKTMAKTSTVKTTVIYTASSTPFSTTSNEGSTTKMSAMTTAGTTEHTTTFTAPSTTNTEVSTMTTTDATTTGTTTIPPSTTSTGGPTTGTTTSTTASTSPSTTSTEESTKTMAKTSTVKTTVIYTASSTPLSTTSNEGSTTKMSAMTTAGTTEHTTTFTAPSTTNTEVSTMTTADATTTSTTTSIPPSTTSTEGPTIPISTSITGLPITASPSTVESTSVTTTQNHNSITSTYVTTTDTNDKIISTDGMKSTSESTTTMTTTIMGSPTLEVSQKTGIVGQDLHLFCNSSYTGTWSYIELTISNQSGGMIEPIATIYSNETVVTPNDEKWTVVFNNINSSFVISRATFKLSNAALGRERCLSDVTFQCSISIGDQTFTNGKTLNISAPPTAPIEIETMHEYIHSSDLEVNCTFKVDPHLSGWTFLEIMNSEEEVERTVPKAITPAGIDNDCSTTIHVQFGKDIPINIENNGSYVRCAYHNDILNHTERSDKKIIIVAVPDVYLDSLNKNPRKEGYLTVEKGNTLFLACRASSTNSLVFKFTKEAQEEVIFGKNDTGQYFATSYISRTATESENGFTLLRIDSITCSDEGTYTCGAVAADGKTVKSSALILEVTGIINFTIHEDFVELFPRLGYNHVCEVQNTGIGSNISVTITSPSGLTDTYELGSSIGVYDDQKKFTRVPLQNADEMFVIREDFITTNGCEITQRLTFLLNISSTWDNGTITCAYTDDDGEQYSQSKLIHMIPRNHCDGYPDSSIRVHPGGCNLFVRCEQIDNALYPFGASCGEQCIDINSNQCENCTTASCHEQTTPAPSPPTTTVDPNLSYLECNDSTLEIGSQSITVDNCVILRNNYTVLNISKQGRSGDAIFIGSITHTSMSIMSSLQFDGTITVVSHRIVFTFNDVQCTDEANYTITLVYEQKILWKTTFQVDVIVNDTHGSLAVQSQYKEGDILSLTGTFFVNSADDIEVYYKYPFDSDYTKAEGTITKDDTPYNCSVKVDWVQKDTLILAAVMNGTRIKAVDKRRSRTLDQFVLIVEATNIGFATYTDDVNIGESANISCTVRGINWNQINITKIENNEASTVLTQIKGQSQPITSIPRVSGLLSEQGSTAILTLMIPDVNCTDSASYNCTALSDTNSIETTGQPFQLRITSPPSTPTLYIHPNWVASLAYATYEHKCSGSIGYPDAKYQMGIKLVSGDGQNEFVYIKKDRPDCQTERHGRQCTVAISTEEKMYVEYDRTAVESCKEEQTIRFILELNYRWDQGNISCFLHNAESDEIEYTTTKTIVLIKADACINATNNDYIRHPNGCDKYIHCSNNIPFGKACSTSNLCVDIPTQRLCIPCDTAQCEEETTTVLASTVSTATPTELTTTPSIIGVTCNSTSTEIGRQNEEIICILHVDNFVLITLRRLSSNAEITSISRNGTISKSDASLFTITSNFQASPKTFTYVISNVNCTVGGTYEVELSLNTSETTKTSFDVNIKPEIPVLSISADSREDSQSAVHSCTGYLGYPKGNFIIEIQEANNTEFSTYDDYVNFESSTSDSCSDTFEQKFALKLPATFNHSKVRCRSENEVTKMSGQEILSNVKDIILISKDHCNTVNGSEYSPHPRGCHYYIRCVHNVPLGFYTGAPNSCVVEYNPLKTEICSSC